MQELDISGCTDIDATAVAKVVAENRALSKLIFGAPDEDSEWEPAVLEIGMMEAGFSNKNLGMRGAIIVSAWLTHKDNGAMTSLDLASNNLGAEGAKIVAEAIKVTKCTPVIILVPFPRKSDFSMNCCCLLLSAGYGGVGVVRRVGGCCGGTGERQRQRGRTDHQHGSSCT
jgi:hypothetical protein